MQREPIRGLTYKERSVRGAVQYEERVALDKRWRTATETYPASNYWEQARNVDWLRYMCNAPKQNSIFFSYPDVEKQLFGTLKLEEKKMNKSIIAVYEKTVDAVLVDKHFGREVQQTFTGELILKQNKEAYLAEATRREELAKSRGENVVC